MTMGAHKCVYHDIHIYPGRMVQLSFRSNWRHVTVKVFHIIKHINIVKRIEWALGNGWDSGTVKRIISYDVRTINPEPSPLSLYFPLEFQNQNGLLPKYNWNQISCKNKWWNFPRDLLANCNLIFLLNKWGIPLFNFHRTTRLVPLIAKFPDIQRTEYDSIIAFVMPQMCSVTQNPSQGIPFHTNGGCSNNQSK